MFDEATLEKITMELLTNLGYETLNGYELERENYSNVILEDDLENAITKLNKNITNEDIKEVIRLIKNLNNNNTILNNKQFTQYLLEGVKVPIQEDGTTRYKTIKVIDFNNIEINTFKAINQYTIIEESEKRPDIIVFINGMPLVVIELKSTTREEVKLEDGYNQLKGYQNVHIPTLFYYNQFLIVSNGAQARAGTITSPWSRFSEWKKIEDTDIVKENMATHNTLFNGMMRKDRIMDIINNFIMWSGDNKILAAYHQYFGVKKAIKSTEKAYNERTGKAGILWHTQGSGKSFSMVFYSANMIKILKNPSIVVVTDRNDLDDQLFNTFSQCSEFLKQKPVQIESRADLNDKLENRISGGIFFTTLQKFEEETGREDSIRNAYIATFPAQPAVDSFARAIGVKPGQIARFITASRGNHGEIMDFLREASRKGCTGRALQLLATLSEKDLRDTPSAVLADHLYNTDKDADAATVLAPRAANEMLTAYRSFLQREIPAADAAAFRRDPQRLAAWCRDSLTLRPELCTVSTTISPEGVWRSRTADKPSRKIFFVAAARSLGIPAWIDPVTGNLFYRHAGKDVPVDFESANDRQLETGRLKLRYEPIPRLDDPEYFRHFTLSRFDGQSFALLNYPDFEPWSARFDTPTDLETGYYMLATGSRLADGSVLANVSFLNIGPNRTTETDLPMRDNSEAVRVIGSFNSESKFIDARTGRETSVLLTAGRGYFVVGLVGVGQEPTDHALKDIAAKAAELEQWGRSIILLFPDETAYAKYAASPAASLPQTVTFGIDRDGSVRRQILDAMHLPGNVPLPVFIVGDTFNRVVFESHGYTIGLGDRFLHTIHQL